MPLIPSTFNPPRWLRGGHRQTIFPALWNRQTPALQPAETLELPDGDFLQLNWHKSGCSRLVILSHGLEGSADAGYIRGLAAALGRAGWDALAWSFRGCGLRPNRLLRFYHSGETGDLAQVIRHAAPAYPAGVALVGFSLGGNMTLKYLGEAAPHSSVIGAAAISAPVDLAASARALDRQWTNHVYLRRFLVTLIAKIEEKARAFPGEIDVTGIRRIRSFQEFDDRYTARLHGFRDAADYWAQSSSRQYLSRINLPTLLLNARDDPFLPAECFPVSEAKANPHLFLEIPMSGGHVGFIDLAEGRQGRTWAERRILDFLKTEVGQKQSPPVKA